MFVSYEEPNIATMETDCTIDSYIDSRIESLQNEGRNVTAGNYAKAKRCLHRYCPDKTLAFSDLTEEFISGFNDFLENSKIQKATISFYNRLLRSLYNQAVRDNLVKNTHPFDNAYTKVVAKLNPITSIKTDSGESVEIDTISKEDLLRQYLTLRGKYNTLVNKLSALMGI